MSLYEVVTGQVRLDSRQRFFHLHEAFLLPAMKALDIKPVVMLMTEIGDYGRFLDIYEYLDFADYGTKTDKLLEHEGMEQYYQEIGGCIHGSIQIQLMRNLPYAEDWTSHA